MVHDEKQFHATAFSSDSDLNGSGSTSHNVAKLAKNTYWKLGLTASLAAATVCLLDHHRTVNATELNHSVVPNSLSVINASHSTRSRSRISSLLPRAFQKIAFSVKSQLANVPKVEPAPKDRLSRTDLALDKLSSNKKLNYANYRNLQPINVLERVTSTHAEPKIALAANSSSTQVQQRIYRVQPGDTINRIAQKLQVSKADLTALNKINNSNIIFVNQQLKIPTAVTESPLDATSRSPSTKLASSKSTSKTNIPASLSKQNSVSPTAPTEDPYITKLKQEIDLLQGQSRDRQSTKSIDLPTASRSLEKSASGVDLDSLSQNNLNSELLKNQAIALRLPPLPPSEEYLPSAFDGYIWPAQGVLTSGYGWRWGRLHQGIDIAAPIGTPVLAAASGVVVGAGWHSGYGNLVKIEHLDGSVTFYGHNQRILVTPGQKVEQGQQIAEMGSTGHSTGSHVHFEIHPESKEAIDPLVLLGSR